MATHVVAPAHGTAPHVEPVHHAAARDALAPIGRLFFAFIFLLAAPGHFTSYGINYAASQGVPFPNVLVPLSGVLAIVGSISVILGYRTRIGATLLVLFLVPVTLMMHRYWSAPDPHIAQLQRVMFLKNLSMLGGALLIAYHGAGPISFDARRYRETTPA